MVLVISFSTSLEIETELTSQFLHNDFKIRTKTQNITSYTPFHHIDALREANSANKDLSRQVTELSSIRVQLEGERDSLAGELADTRDALRDAQARLDAANAALAQLRSDMEARLREKDDEIENIR